MKRFATITLLLAAPLHSQETANEDVSYNYLKLSDQWIIFPGFGAGYRSHNRNGHGFDADLSAYSYWDMGFSLYAKGHYLFYPRQDHFYLGIGAGIIGGWCSAHVGGGPLTHSTFGDGVFIKPTVEGVLGYEWKIEKRPLFIQLEVGGSYGSIPLYPTLSFGIGF
jgi:hypothetical protein